ncbi:MAG: phage tail family protein, partial [Defluviitaleaceae bacterium]|nr:phage tail family protein [Defluviitaleaceae bacterium]
CLDPFWYGLEITRTIPASGLTFENIGDSTAGFIVALDGTASHPFIENGNNVRITFMGNISNQTLRFISMPDRSMVERGGVNAMQFLSDPRLRSFFLLNIGTNTVRFGAATGAANLTASLSYRPRYLGTF